MCRRAGRAARSGELQKVLLQRPVGLLCGRQISRLKLSSQISEKCRRTTLLSGRLRAAGMAVMMAITGHGPPLLKILLESREIRLCGRKIARFQVLGKLSDRLRNGIARLRDALRSRLATLRLAGEQLLERGEVGLRLRQTAGVEILPKLLKVLTNLPKLGVGGGELEPAKKLLAEIPDRDIFVSSKVSRPEAFCLGLYRWSIAGLRFCFRNTVRAGRPV